MKYKGRKRRMAAQQRLSQIPLMLNPIAPSAKRCLGLPLYQPVMKSNSLRKSSTGCLRARLAFGQASRRFYASKVPSVTRPYNIRADLTVQSTRITPLSESIRPPTETSPRAESWTFRRRIITVISICAKGRQVHSNAAITPSTRDFNPDD